MADQDNDSPVVDLRMVTILVALAASAVLIPLAFTSSRPASHESLEQGALGDQIIPARLWQDPFEVAASFRSAHDEEIHLVDTNGQRHLAPFFSLTEVGRQVRRHAAPAADGQTNSVTVLEVMISGGSYAEDAEARHRARYAVLSALSVAGYVPSDEGHIGYAEQGWPRGEIMEHVAPNAIPRLDDTNLDAQSDLCLPYEWFAPNGMRPHETLNDVLVLWLNAEAFEDYPAKRLAQLNERLQHKEATNQLSSKLSKQLLRLIGSRGPPRVDFKLIDPSLGAILEEPLQPRRPLECANGFDLGSQLPSISIYSSWSTTADALLEPEASPGGPRRGAVEEELRARGWGGFHNATCTDDELAEELVDELLLRGTDVTDPNQGIVLISESDTTYGRALPLTFAAVARSRSLAKEPPGNRQANESLLVCQAMATLKTNATAWPSNILARSYFRGIDGVAPGESEAETKEGPESAKKRFTQPVPRPEGHSQLDYLPRMAEILGEIDRFRAEGFEIKAIGVLGSDVYDKLLVLQSLRRHFTRPLFFTTDLDARLLHPDSLNWTRNVIVASSYGLALTNTLQAGVAPFRDTYQTGQYLACLAALQCPRALEALDKIAPRRFEIGRNGASDLSVTSGFPYPMRSTFPCRLPSWWRILLLAGSCVWLGRLLSRNGPVSLGDVLADAWAGQAHRDQPPMDPAQRRLCRSVMIAGPLALGAFMAAALWSNADPRGDPFTLMDGTSIWPSECIRVLAAALALVFVFTSQRGQEINKQRLHKELGLPRFPHPGPTEKGKVFSAYDKAGAFRERIRRRGQVVVAYCVFGAAVFCLFPDPFVPYRGALSRYTDMAVNVVAGLLEIMLLFFVIDTTRGCKRLIANIRGAKEPAWPHSVIDKLQDKFSGPAEYLYDYIDVRVIAERTAAITPLVFGPFIVLFLMIVARARVFERWDWPVSLVVVFGLNSAMAVYAATMVRKDAEALRTASLENVQNKLTELKNAGKDDWARQLKLLRREIKECDRGSFKPLLQQPAIRAIAVPLTAILGTLIEGFASQQ